MRIEDYIRQPLPFENEINEYFAKEDPITIFEVGACEGEDTVRLRRRFPHANIYAFEPLPKNIKRIHENFRRYQITSVDVHALALSDKDGEAEFYVSSGHPDDLPKTNDWDYGNKSSSLLAPKETKKIHKWLKFNNKIKVKTRRLDSFCKENGIDNIDFMFLDVQGAELKVLKGLGESLSIVKMIWMEVEAVELYSKQPLKRDVESFMKSKGYKCIKNTVNSVSGDQLYVHKTLRPNRRGLLSKLNFPVRRKH